MKDLLLESLNAGSWEWDIQTGDEEWSDLFYEILGYSRGDLKPTYETFINFLVEPSHKNMVESAVEDHLNKKTPYDVKILMLTKTEGYQWFRSIGKALFEDGNPVYMIGAY